jgi:hypothetical protein
MTPMAHFAKFDLDVPYVAMVTATHNDNGWTGSWPRTFGPEGGSYQFHEKTRSACTKSPSIGRSHRGKLKPSAPMSRLAMEYFHKTKLAKIVLTGGYSPTKLRTLSRVFFIIAAGQEWPRTGVMVLSTQSFARLEQPTPMFAARRYQWPPKRLQ